MYQLPNEQLKEVRHRYEIPCYRLGIVINFILIPIIIAGVVIGGEAAESAKEDLSYLAIFLVLPFLTLIFLFWNYAKIRANGLEITGKQFPEVYKVYTDLAKKMGIPEDKTPKLYLQSGQGKINAYATKCSLNRSYAVVYSDIFEIVQKHGDYSTLKFVLAHELGHIVLGHVNIRRVVLTYLAGLFPPFRQSMTRAQELSADRVAAKFAPEAIERGPILLAAGKNLYTEVNRDAYLEQLRNEKQDLFLRGVNLMSGHPILVKRVIALDDIRKHGLEKHGDLF